MEIKTAFIRVYHYLVQSLIHQHPSHHGEECPYNGEQPDFECCCDECDHYLTCFPDWKEIPGHHTYK